MKEITVFNNDNIAYKTGVYPLFGGQEPALYDSINQPYPKFKELMEKLKQLDWAVDDVDLTETRMDLMNMSKEMRELALMNIAYQWSIDSAATSIPTLLAPFVTNTEYSHVLARIGENENLHSDTYSDAVRQCVPDPQEVFAMVHENDKVVARSGIVREALSDLKRYGAEYTLGLKTFEECMPIILRGLVAIYSLERISFMSSFACTFAVAEQGFMVGFARLVQKILIDEMIHFETQRYALKEVLFKDNNWINIIESEKNNLSMIVNGVVEQELSWNRYLFQGGRAIVGLNEGILNDWTRYCAQEVIDNLELEQNFRKTVTCPLPWFEQDWMDLNSQQNANMESDATNYMVSSVGRDVSGVDFEDLPLTLSEDLSVSYVVYSKPECPFCVKLKTFMEDNNILYQDIRVDLYPDEKEWLISEGLRTVPQVFDQEGNYHGDCTSFIQKHS